MEVWLQEFWTWLESSNFIYAETSGAKTGKWFLDYQSLFGGIIAAFGSAIAVWGVFKLQSRQLYLKSKSKLSLALLDLSEYANNCLWMLVCPHKALSGGPTYTISTERVPESSLEVIAELSALVRSRDAKMLRRLIEFVQVQHSRQFSNILRERRYDGALEIEVEEISDMVVQASALRLMVEHLFDYARWRDKSIPYFPENKAPDALKHDLQKHFPPEVTDNAAESAARLAHRRYHLNSA